MDNTSADLPFYYNEASYQFAYGEEHFLVKISPSYREVKVQVIQQPSNRLLSLLDLKRVEKFEIIADKKDHSSVLLTVVNDDSLQTIELDFKPRFKLIFKEHFTG
ncbi:hypothetical protein JOC77_001615 [Peribacillus deserti]|uniref:Uncharacterized protein n=1 Tax=Peribacillus deserti TaxID=673318 RepID=A0ABS2QGB0_9BACI|nr:hypothetical protein [Peribacillus deserti]MBM7692188.1 hypothetical protein [Peribacillus deserti]